MHAAAVSFDLHVPASRSLKAKRAAIRPIVDGLRHRFKVSVAEVDHQDQWQRATIGVAVVGEQRRPARARCSTSVERFVARRARRRAARHRDRAGSSWRTRDVQRRLPRRYPRTARVNEVVREVLADELERLSDPRLGSRDGHGRRGEPRSRHANVYYSVLGDRPATRRRRRVATTPPTRSRRGAAPAGGRSGSRCGCKYRPELPFREDPGDRAGPADRRDPPRSIHDGAAIERARRATRRTYVSDGPGDRVDDALDARREGASTRAGAVALACHVNPDGDALGSMLGLLPRAARRRAATSSRRSRRRSSSRRTTASSRARPAHAARGVPRRARRDGHVRLRLARPPRRPRGRRRRPRDELDRPRPPHLEHRYGTINVIDPDAAASGVLVRRLIDELGLPLDDATPRCRLYAALVCDTGRFQYETTTPDVFDARRRARRVRRAGVTAVARTLFEEHRFAYLQAPRRGARQRRARTRAAVRVDRGHPGDARAPRRDARGGRGPHRHPAPHHRGRGHVRAQGGAGRHGAGEPALARRGRRAPRSPPAHGGGGHRFAAGFSLRRRSSTSSSTRIRDAL